MYCVACGALMPRPAPLVIIKEAGPYELRYRPAWMGREKMRYLSVRVAVALVLIVVALYLTQVREYDCDTEYIPGLGWRETCTPLYEQNVLGLILLCGGIALLIYSFARTALD